MRKTFTGFSVAVLMLCSVGAWAQLEDQNPRFQESLQYYSGVSDSLVQNQSVTVQDTYQAYDFYQAKLERRAQRRADRQERRINQNYYSSYNYPGYYNYSRWIPTIGFRTGDFWFSF